MVTISEIEKLRLPVIRCMCIICTPFLNNYAIFRQRINNSTYFTRSCKPGSVEEMEGVALLLYSFIFERRGLIKRGIQSEEMAAYTSECGMW